MWRNKQNARILEETNVLKTILLVIKNSHPAMIWSYSFYKKSKPWNLRTINQWPLMCNKNKPKRVVIPLKWHKIN